MKNLVLSMVVCCVGAVQTERVYLDLSGAYNYDAFATKAEISANGVLWETLGDHNLDYGQLGRVHCVGGASGIPADGLVDQQGFELGRGLARKFDSEDGKTKVNNSISFVNRGDVLKKVATVTLVPAEQRQYATLNVLVNGNRYGHRKEVVLSAEIEVKYVGDDAWHSLWLENAAIDNGEPGGCFGGAADNDEYCHQSDAWVPVSVSRVIGKTSGNKTVMSSGEIGNMYKLAKPLELDPAKRLEGFRLTATHPESRINEFILYAATATTADGQATVTAAPEPEKIVPPKKAEVSRPAGPYEAWATRHGLVEGPNGDDDKDNVSNLYEFGLGGDPTDAKDTGMVPLYGDIGEAGHDFVYIFPRRIDAGTCLTYQLQRNGVPAAKGDCEEIKTTELNSEYEAVVVRISPAVNDRKDIHLRLILN